MRKDQAQHTLEEIVDLYGLTDTLAMLAEVCYEKAAHLQVHWQDSDGCKVYTRAGVIVEKASGDVGTV